MPDQPRSNRQRRMIGVALGPRTTLEAESVLREAAVSADIAELRLDYMDEYDLTRLLRNRPCPVIVTNRAEREGGRFRGSEADRIKPLLQAIDFGVEFVDIEHDAVELISDRGQTRLIASYHDFQETPRNFLEIHQALASKGADVVKVVGMARQLRDNLLVFDALAQSSVPTIAIAMGESGLVSRILALRYDACLLTFATLGTGERVAPGQISVATMRDVYHAQSISPQTAVYALLGVGVISTDTIASLNARTRPLGLDAVWVPLAASGNAGDTPADVVWSFRRLGVAGYVVDASGQESAALAVDDAVSRGPDGRINAIRRIGDQLIGAWAASDAEAVAFALGHLATLTSP